MMVCCPAITFIFSRAGCDAAVKQCLRSSLRLTTEEERRTDRRDRRPPHAPISTTPTWWCSTTTSGARGCCVAWPPTTRACCRRSVIPSRSCSPAGLVKAVFATETLAFGINMPARTVVLERLVKFNGEQHVPLTPGEYTQLTGRAGRRGIDVEGHAVVLWNPDVDPAEVAGLASTRTFPLRSSFAPSYNMTINLVHQMGPDQAHQLLERSFAQYQADRSVVGLVRGVERGERMLDEIAAEIGGRERADPRLRAAARADLRTGARPVAGVAAAAPTGGQRGADRAAPRRHHHDHPRQARGLAVVLEPARDDDDPRPLVLTEHRWAGRISSADYSGVLATMGTMTLPKRVEHRNPRVRRDLASALRSAAAGRDVPSARGRRSGPPPEHDIDPELTCLRDRMRAHRAHSLPDREDKARVAERYLRSSATTTSFAEDRRGHELAGADLRPDRRTAHRTWVHRRGRRSRRGRRCPGPGGHRRRQAAGPHLQRKRSAGGRMPARRCLGGTRRRPSSRLRCRRCSTSPAGSVHGGVRRRRADRSVAARAESDPQAVDRAPRRRAAAPDHPEPRARRRFRRRDPPVGDHRRPGVRVGRVRHHRHRIDDVGGRLRAVVPPGARLGRPGAQCRSVTGVAGDRETRNQRRSARRRSC